MSIHRLVPSWLGKNVQKWLSLMRKEPNSQFGGDLVPNLCLTLATPRTVGCQQPPLSMGLTRQEYWNGLSFPSPGNLPDPRVQLMSPLWVGSLPTEPPG